MGLKLAKAGKRGKRLAVFFLHCVRTEYCSEQEDNVLFLGLCHKGCCTFSFLLAGAINGEVLVSNFDLYG